MSVKSGGVVGTDSGQKRPILWTCVQTKRGSTGEIFQLTYMGIIRGPALGLERISGDLLTKYSNANSARHPTRPT